MSRELTGLFVKGIRLGDIQSTRILTETISLNSLVRRTVWSRMPRKRALLQSRVKRTRRTACMNLHTSQRG